VDRWLDPFSFRSPYVESNAWDLRHRGRHQFADGVKDDAELSIIFLLQFRQLAGKFSMVCKEAPKTNEGSHDLDIRAYPKTSFSNRITQLK